MNGTRWVAGFLAAFCLAAAQGCENEPMYAGLGDVLRSFGASPDGAELGVAHLAESTDPTVAFSLPATEYESYTKGATTPIGVAVSVTNWTYPASGKYVHFYLDGTYSGQSQTTTYT